MEILMIEVWHDSISKFVDGDICCGEVGGPRGLDGCCCDGEHSDTVSLFEQCGGDGDPGDWGGHDAIVDGGGCDDGKVGGGGGHDG